MPEGQVSYHVEAQGQLALRNHQRLGGRAGALGEDGDEVVDVHGAAGDEVDLALGDVAVVRVHLGGSNRVDGLALAVVLEEVRLLEPLLAYRGRLQHVVVILEVGLRRDRGVLLVVRDLARGVDVDLRLHAVELDVGYRAVGGDGISASGGVALRKAVALVARGLARIAHRAHGVHVEGVALLRAAHARVIARAHNAGDEVAERHRDARDKVGVGRLARVVQRYVRDLLRSLADAVLLKGLNLLEPLRVDAARAAHRVVVLQLHLAQELSAHRGYKLAGGVKVHLALNGVYLAVDYHALAVYSDGVDVHVRLGQSVGLRRRVGGAAVPKGQVSYHVEAQGQLALRDLDRLAARSLLLGRGAHGSLAGVLDHGDAAAGQQTDAEKQRKYDCSQLLHYVSTSRYISHTGNYGAPRRLRSPGLVPGGLGAVPRVS